MLRFLWWRSKFVSDIYLLLVLYVRALAIMRHKLIAWVVLNSRFLSASFCCFEMSCPLLVFCWLVPPRVTSNTLKFVKYLDIRFLIKWILGGFRTRLLVLAPAINGRGTTRRLARFPPHQPSHPPTRQTNHSGSFGGGYSPNLRTLTVLEISSIIIKTKS